MKKIALLTSLFLFSATTWAKDASVTLEVPTMNCVTCPYTVQKALEKVDGVTRADVDFDSKLAVVSYDDTKASPETLTDATKNAGYPSSVNVGAINGK